MSDKNRVEGVTVTSEQGIGSFIPCIPEKTSDGYHTFSELYEHRIILYLALMSAHLDRAWISHVHEDGGSFDGWFLAGIELPAGQISYHLPDRYWDKAVAIGIRDLSANPPKWDGHSSEDVLQRILAGLEGDDSVTLGTWGDSEAAAFMGEDYEGDRND